MTEKGQYPLVYQLEERNGVMVPVGLAEVSSIVAASLTVSSISAIDYLGLTATFDFTGVLTLTDTTAIGESLIDNTDSNNPKIRPLAVNLDDFMSVTNPDNTVSIGYGTNALSVIRGGTGLTTIEDNQIIVGTGTNTIGVISAPINDNTYLKWTGAALIWTGVEAGAASFPSTAGRIPVTDTTTNLNTYSELTFDGTTKVLSTYAINNVCDVCAIRFNEGGTLLSDKYQGKDPTLTTIANLTPAANQLIYFTNTDAATTASLTQQGRELLDDTSFADMRTTLQLNSYYQACDVFLDTLSTQGYVNLNSVDVCNTLPVAKGGTGSTSFPQGTIIYSDTVTIPYQLISNVNFKFEDNILKSPAVCATEVCAATFNENGQTLSIKYFDRASTGVFETTANAQSTYLAKTSFNTWSGALALSAGLKDVDLISTPPTINQVLKWNGSKWLAQDDSTGAGATTPVGPEGAVQFKSGSNSFTGVDKFVFNQTSSILQLNAVSAPILYAAGTGQIKTPKANYVYYGSPTTITYDSITYPKGAITQDTNGEFWFSSNAVIAGATQPGPSSTLFVRRVCVGGTQTTTNNIGVVFGRFAANPGIGPGFDPVDLDPPQFITTTSVGNYLTYINSSGDLCYASALNTYKKNGSLSAQPDTLQVGGNLITETFSATLDATIDGDITTPQSVFANNVESQTVSATNYLNLPSATITWLEAQDVVLYVKNKNPTTAIPKGTPVAVVSGVGDNPIVEPLSSVNYHVPEAIGFSNHVAGLAQETIDADGFGHIVVEGLLTNLNTNAWNVGDWLYVSSNGQLNNTRPPAPYESHPVGFVVRKHATVGVILVKIENSPEINDIVGFNLNTSLLNGDLITYDLTTSTFVNKQTVNVSGQGKFGSVSATTYLNLPTSALSGLSDVLITSPALSSVLKWNGSKWVPAADQDTIKSPVGGQYAIQVDDGAGNFYGDSTVTYDYDIGKVYISTAGLQVDAVATFNNGVDFTQPITFTSATGTHLKATTVSATTISATNYINLPQTNASAIRGYGVSAVSPVNNQILVFNSSISNWVSAYQPAEIGIACSDETTNLTSGTAKATFRMPYAMYLNEVRANVNTAPSGSIIIVDVNKNGTTIFSTRVTIDSAEKTSKTAATAAVITTNNFADDDEITIDIDQVGSTTAGKGLKVWLIGRRT